MKLFKRFLPFSTLIAPLVVGIFGSVGVVQEVQAQTCDGLSQQEISCVSFQSTAWRNVNKPGVTADTRIDINNLKFSGGKTSDLGIFSGGSTLFRTTGVGRPRNYNVAITYQTSNMTASNGGWHIAGTPANLVFDFSVGYEGMETIDITSMRGDYNMSPPLTTINSNVRKAIQIHVRARLLNDGISGKVTLPKDLTLLTLYANNEKGVLAPIATIKIGGNSYIEPPTPKTCTTITSGFTRNLGSYNVAQVRQAGHGGTVSGSMHTDTLMLKCARNLGLKLKITDTAPSSKRTPAALANTLDNGATGVGIALQYQFNNGAEQNVIVGGDAVSLRTASTNTTVDDIPIVIKGRLINIAGNSGKNVTSGDVKAQGIVSITYQ